MCSSDLRIGRAPPADAGEGQPRYTSRNAQYSTTPRGESSGHDGFRGALVRAAGRPRNPPDALLRRCPVHPRQGPIPSVRRPIPPLFPGLFGGSPSDVRATRRPPAGLKTLTEERLAPIWGASSGATWKASRKKTPEQGPPRRTFSRVGRINRRPENGNGARRSRAGHRFARHRSAAESRRVDRTEGISFPTVRAMEWFRPLRRASIASRDGLKARWPDRLFRGGTPSGLRSASGRAERPASRPGR